jgi:hypothetical protein
MVVLVGNKCLACLAGPVCRLSGVLGHRQEGLMSDYGAVMSDYGAVM